MTYVSLNLLTNSTWKLKTPGELLVFRVLVQVWLKQQTWRDVLCSKVFHDLLTHQSSSNALGSKVPNNLLKHHPYKMPWEMVFHNY